MIVPRLVSTAASQLPINSSRSSGLCCCLPSSPLAGLNLTILRTREGLVKLAQIILSTICQNLLLHYGITYSVSLGTSYDTFLTTCSSSSMTSFSLLVTYVFSIRSMQLLRQSMFELIFNGIISFMYISSSCYLAFALYTYMYPVLRLASLFQLYPEMSFTYIFGFAAGTLHGYDAWLAYKTRH